MAFPNWATETYKHYFKILISNTNNNFTTFVRFRMNEAIVSEIIHQVQQNPVAVSHIPEALQYLATTDAILTDSPKLVHMLTWSRVSPVQVNYPEMFAFYVILICVDMLRRWPTSAGSFRRIRFRRSTPLGCSVLIRPTPFCFTFLS